MDPSQGTQGLVQEIKDDIGKGVSALESAVGIAPSDADADAIEKAFNSNHWRALKEPLVRLANRVAELEKMFG